MGLVHRLPNPSFEVLRDAEEESIRSLSWDESLAHPRVFHGNASYLHYDGMGDRWHYHAELEVTHFSTGEGLRFVGDSIQRFEAPDTVFLGPHLPHCWTCKNSSGVAVQCRLSNNSFLATLPEFLAVDNLRDRANLGLHLKGSLSSEVASLLQSMQNQGALSRLANFLKIIETIANAKLNQFSILSQPIKIRAGAGAYSNTIADAIEFISQRFQDPIELPDLLSHIGMSRASFSRHFASFTGRSFTTFLQQIRLEYCRKLLATCDYTITEAATQSGFQNLSHFNQLFRRRWGETPRDFRNALYQSK